MDYTREPIVESVITAREGCKLAIRSSKGMNQEEYFLDAVELVTFGHAQFFRSLDKPKPFLLPVQDYEILEVREPRMVLKNVGIDRSIKIGSEKKQPQQQQQQQPKKEQPQKQEQEVSSEDKEELKKRQKRSHRRRGKTSPETVEGEEALVQATEEEVQAKIVQSPSAMSALLAPPPTLISETLSKYRSNDAYKQAFYERETSAETETEAESAPAPITPYIPTDEDFDEGDHIIFGGHEPVTEAKPFEEEAHPIDDNLPEEIISEDFLKEDTIPFEDRDEHL